jgi:hypothetical protein
MRTYVTEYDLSRPPAIIWGLSGYTHAIILVRNHGRPLDILRVTKNPASAALTELDLEREIDDRLGISVTLRSGFDRIFPTITTEWPAISVIVCTRDRPYALRRCLGALSRLDYDSYEVVVIDNASRTSETLEVVKGTPYRYVREERQGLDWARNRGVREARHDIVAFVDDDAIVDSGWLRGMARGLPIRVMAVTGLVLLPN